MKGLLIVKAGKTFPSVSARLGDFDSWVISSLNLADDKVAVVDAFTGCELPDCRWYSGIVVTGAHSMVTDREPWSERLAIWMQGAVKWDIPILGICYGHQLLAHAMGGTVGYHAGGMEIGTVRIMLNSKGVHDPLLGMLPREFYAHVAHSQTVLRLPKRAQVLASNAFEPHHAFVIGDCAWGVQFHPEFRADMLWGYIAEMASELEQQGISTDKLLQSLRETPEANRLIGRFADLCLKEEAGPGSAGA